MKRADIKFAKKVLKILMRWIFFLSLYRPKFTEAAIEDQFGFKEEHLVKTIYRVCTTEANTKKDTNSI